jgi:hypothetical protein
MQCPAGTLSFGKSFKCIHKSQGNQVCVNHFTRLQQPKRSNKEPSCEPIRELTKRLGHDALLPVNERQYLAEWDV